MSLKLFNRLETIDYLIKVKKTGTPSQLAQRLSISKRSLYDLINMMRSLGAPIKYSKYRNSYYYTEEGRINVKFKKTLEI